MSVWDDRPEYASNLVDLALIRDIMGGTRSMRGDAPSAQSIASPLSTTIASRGGSTPWLPRFPGDSDDSYAMRWDRAICNGAFAHAVENIVGKATSASVHVNAAPDYLAAIEINADRQGTSLHRFVSAHLQRKVSFGGSGILVAMPSRESVPTDLLQPESGNVPETVKAALDIRPYFVPVHRLAVRAWEWRERIGGGRELVYLAIREDDVTKRVGTDWVTTERMRTWELTDAGVIVQDYERPADAKKREKGAGETPISTSTINLPCIPFVWDACDDPQQTTDTFAGAPPMVELAYLQLAHFRETSEQGVAMLMARSEALVEEGCDPKDVKSPLHFAGGRALRTAASPQEHRIAYVGPSGIGVTHGETSLRHIEDAMERIGAAPLARKAGTETATGKALDNTARESIAAGWVEGTQDAFEAAFEIADLFARPTVADPVGQRLLDLEVCIPGMELLSADQVQVQVEELRTGVRDVGLPKRIYVEALSTRGYLPEGTDVDAILAEMDQAEQASLTRTFAAQDAALRLVQSRGQMDRSGASAAG